MMASDISRQLHPHQLHNFHHRIDSLASNPYRTHSWPSEGTESLVQALQQHGRRSSHQGHPHPHQHQQQQQQQQAGPNGLTFFSRNALLVPQQQRQQQPTSEQPGSTAFRAVAQPHRIDNGEHMLRRKTPNGTLSAGYDGTPVEWASAPGANKHLLISGSQDAGHIPYSNTGLGHGNPALRGRSNGGRDMWVAPAVSSPPQARPGYDAQPVYHGQPVSLDSMLHQGTNAQFFYNGLGFQQTPTVLPHMWPPSNGPTASNAQGPFGPYWPNGVFEPYRPAPLRDARFNSQFAGISLNDPSPEPIQRRSSRSWPQNPLKTELLQQSNSMLGQQHNNAHNDYRESTRQHDINQHHLFNRQERAEASTDAHFAQLPAGHPGATNQGESNQWSQPELLSQYHPAVSSQLTSQDNLQFRDKTLVWAHRVYVNLLQFLQQTRRMSQTSRQPSERRHSHQPPYLPKPPHYTSVSSEAINSSSRRGSVNLLTGGAQGQGQGQNFGQSPDADGSRRSSMNSVQLFSGNPHANNKFNDRFDRGYGIESSNFNLNSSGLQNYRQSNGISSPPSIPQQFPHQQSQSWQEAQAAFEMLARLVHESSWQWIDGMLLGGCLAYGLGDHKSAFEWYSRVLVCDPNHVEAISNLAATLAMLGQLKEAEQNWLRAVKLRPGYFEAVEHLIGLLCQDGRARDAVRVIDFMESCLRQDGDTQTRPTWEMMNEATNGQISPRRTDAEKYLMGLSLSGEKAVPSGYKTPPAENGRLIALIHAKGNMLYGLGDNLGASKAFEDAVMIAAGKGSSGISGLIKHILRTFSCEILAHKEDPTGSLAPCEAILLLPNMALQTAELVFPGGCLPGFRDVPDGQSRRAAISVASNSLLSLAKIYQDGMSSSNATPSSSSAKAVRGVQDILALYYLSLSLQPSPSTANNVGILLAGVQHSVSSRPTAAAKPAAASGADPETPVIPGVIPGSGIALALAYYNYGLNLDKGHAHLYTNLGSLLKDIGQLNAAIKMYEEAVKCDSSFDIALANLANAVKDQGRISDAIGYYKRAVHANPEFPEAVCGLANALNSVCNWTGRGGVTFSDRKYDRWHVDDQGMLLDATHSQSTTAGWIGRVVSIVDKQLRDGKSWGRGVLQTREGRELLSLNLEGSSLQEYDGGVQPIVSWLSEAGQDFEGARIVRLVERATKRLSWQIYQEKYVKKKTPGPRMYARPAIPASLAVPSAPTVLPFHTFTCPLTADQIRKISQRNGLRISTSTLKAPWLPSRMFEPPAPPKPQLNVGYVSSDFNNHPLAHLMQSVFGFHDSSRVKAFCYATTTSDKSSHREKIEKEAPVFRDASAWPVDRLVKQILDDGIHILINLNGYTRGARNEVFAARPAPIQMSFMGFAGTLGAEWCDYLFADTTSIPLSTLRPYRRNVDLADLTRDKNYTDEQSDWVYGENIIYARDSFFCCDHRQSAPDSQEPRLSWPDELRRRRKMRKELFPNLPDDAVILGNFNQLYKIEPTTFRTWLRILQNIPTAVLWLLRFPDLGEQNLRQTALQWASPAVASRIIFTDVAPKNQHIARARVCDLFLDTPECNAHTTAADVLWSGTPLLTYPRYEFKMCSRMAASILKGALPRGEAGDRAAEYLIAPSESVYEERAVEMGLALAEVFRGRSHSCWLLELRRLIYEGRWTSPLFDTRRWVRDLEESYEIAWQRWVDGEGGDIWLER